jgi:hypothetical protein
MLVRPPPALMLRLTSLLTATAAPAAMLQRRRAAPKVGRQPLVSPGEINGLDRSRPGMPWLLRPQTF